MSDTWFTADQHLGDEPMCTYESSPGVKLRPFATAKEMDEALLERWNEVVKPGDKVYVVGDCGDHRKLDWYDRANGKKMLIDGNHDEGKTQLYLKYFKYVRAFRFLSDHGLVLTHIPVHPLCLNPKWGANVHGHTHSNSMPEPDYLCVSVEQTDYRPIHVEDVMKRLREQGSTAHMALMAKRAATAAAKAAASDAIEDIKED